jgi:hypothetical protein
MRTHPPHRPALAKRLEIVHVRDGAYRVTIDGRDLFRGLPATKGRRAKGRQVRPKIGVTLDAIMSDLDARAQRREVSKVHKSRVLQCLHLITKPKRDLSELDMFDGARLLAKLKGEGLSATSVRDYYSAFQRELALAGQPCRAWPKAPKAPPKPEHRTRDNDRLKSWRAAQDPSTLNAKRRSARAASKIKAALQQQQLISADDGWAARS